MTARSGLVSKICFLLLLATTTVAGEAASSADVKQVPFKIDRNRIVIPTSVNGSAELRLILDTGMRFDGVYLFHEELASAMDTTGAIEVKVPGAGLGQYG